MNAKRIFSGITATVMAISILTVGTFAWQSISQNALNEVKGSPLNAGGRLHDDFNGENKDIYVENFTDCENGGRPIYARIKLREYLEIGDKNVKHKLGAGRTDTGEPDKTGVTIVGKSDAKINDKTTWEVHKLDNQNPNRDPDDRHNNAIHEYYEWDTEQENKKVYMPTFNQNKDSLEADINGTLQGKDGTPYGDYNDWQKGDTTQGNVVKDADNDTVDEGDSAVEGTNITTQQNVTHTAKTGKHKTTDIITMEEWKAKTPEEKNNNHYWVYDTDGWAYYSQPIYPGETSGLILDGIRPTNKLKEGDKHWYYAIDVEAEFASKGDWGKEADKTGFYQNGMLPTGLALLNEISEKDRTDAGGSGCAPVIPITGPGNDENMETEEDNVIIYPGNDGEIGGGNDTIIKPGDPSFGNEFEPILPNENIHIGNGADGVFGNNNGTNDDVIVQIQPGPDDKPIIVRRDSEIVIYIGGNGRADLQRGSTIPLRSEVWIYDYGNKLSNRQMIESGDVNWEWRSTRHSPTNANTTYTKINNREVNLTIAENEERGYNKAVPPLSILAKIVLGNNENNARNYEISSYKDFSVVDVGADGANDGSTN